MFKGYSQLQVRVDLNNVFQNFNQIYLKSVLALVSRHWLAVSRTIELGICIGQQENSMGFK